MKISKTPTEWLLVTVASHNGIDVLDYVLVHLTSQQRNAFTHQLHSALSLRNTQSFKSVNYEQTPYGWYAYDSEGIKGHLHLKGLSWTFINWDHENELDDLGPLSDTVEGIFLQVLPNGNALFYATSQSIKEPIYTSQFPLPNILMQLDEGQ